MRDQAATQHDWHPLPNPCGLAALLGPVLRRRDGDSWVFGLRIEAKHTNNAGIMHGGTMMALLDEAVGNIVREAAGRRHVTIQMNTNFLRKGEVGEMVQAAATITRMTRSMTFVDARLTVGGETVATASLIFKAIVLPSPAQAAPH